MQRAKVSVSRQRWDELNGKLVTLEAEMVTLHNRIAALTDERDRLRADRAELRRITKIVGDATIGK